MFLIRYVRKVVIFIGQLAVFHLKFYSSQRNVFRLYWKSGFRNKQFCLWFNRSSTTTVFN